MRTWRNAVCWSRYIQKVATEYMHRFWLLNSVEQRTVVVVGMSEMIAIGGRNFGRTAGWVPGLVAITFWANLISVSMFARILVYLIKVVTIILMSWRDGLLFLWNICIQSALVIMDARLLHGFKGFIFPWQLSCIFKDWIDWDYGWRAENPQSTLVKTIQSTVARFWFSIRGDFRDQYLLGTINQVGHRLCKPC